jgi:O-antigen/teichoic acid export membrane protein
MQFAMVIDITDAVSRLILSIGWVLLGFGALGVTFGYGITSLLIIGLALGILRRLTNTQFSTQLDVSPNHYQPILITKKDLIFLGVPNLFIRGTLLLAGPIGVTIIGLYFGSFENVAIFYISLNIALVLSIIANAFSAVIIPSISTAVNQETHSVIDNVTNYGIRFFLIFTIPLVISGVFFADVILGIIGPQYIGAISTFQILILSTLFLGLAILANATLNGLGQKTALFALSILFIGIYLLLSLVLIFFLALIGASLAFLISVLSLAFVSIIYLHKKVKIAFGEVLKIILMNIIFSGMIFSLVSLFQLSIFSLLIALPIYILLCVLTNLVTLSEIKVILRSLGDIFSKTD